MAPSKAKGNNNAAASSPSDTSMADTNSHVNGGYDEDSVMVRSFICALFWLKLFKGSNETQV